ncbi:T9SS type A sorting domain-containing protein [Flavobacterium sp. J372]|uniref:T9SS type A sorting domain-containing protein n=1 Tax=Flavobacterium sp. J372 TaxID=2898436 RepID=UPI002151AD07|nr:T9SS type A sorting domain-containing protein [Flavobacterium sp. J372]MCR5861026.1 T9SS type A sorting domain-containing protein [Flavobacterium sp. J372]
MNNEGYASISDSNGNLLFYTDGKKVWNKNHTVMANGTIGYYPDFTQPVIIIPHPGDSNKYYIVKNEQYICLCVGVDPPGHYMYSIVDFTNNSLGEVLNINSTPFMAELTTTKMLSNAGSYIEHKGSYAPLTAARSSDGNYWVVVQDENSMLSYKIDGSGLNLTPVVSSFTSNQIYNYGNYYPTQNTYSGIRRSMIRVAQNPSISKLYGLESSSLQNANTDPVSQYARFYSLEFNSLTGMFSNYNSIPLSYSNSVSYNFELSPDLQTAYFATYKRPHISTGNDGEVIAKDLTSGTAPRLLYEQISSTTPSAYFSFIQKDKYGNVLVGSTYTNSGRNTYLHKIENPNSYLTSAVKVNHISLNGGGISPFPQLIPSQEESCIPDITLSVPETNSNHVYQASNSVTTNNTYTINSGNDITMKAGAFVVMKPNTHIKSGSLALAKIEDCEEGSVIEMATARMSSPSDPDMYKKALFTMYPNPAHDRLTVSAEAGITTVTISSIEGMLMYSTKLSGKETSQDVDVSQYRKGIYIVNITTADGKTESQKLMKD